MIYIHTYIHTHKHTYIRIYHAKKLWHWWCISLKGTTSVSSSRYNYSCLTLINIYGQAFLVDCRLINHFFHCSQRSIVLNYNPLLERQVFHRKPSLEYNWMQKSLQVLRHCKRKLAKEINTLSCFFFSGIISSSLVCTSSKPWERNGGWIPFRNIYYFSASSTPSGTIKIKCCHHLETAKCMTIQIWQNLIRKWQSLSQSRKNQRVTTFQKRPTKWCYHGSETTKC